MLNLVLMLEHLMATMLQRLAEMEQMLEQRKDSLLVLGMD